MSLDETDIPSWQVYADRLKAKGDPRWEALQSIHDFDEMRFDTSLDTIAKFGIALWYCEKKNEVLSVVVYGDGRSFKNLVDGPNQRYPVCFPFHQPKDVKGALVNKAIRSQRLSIQKWLCKAFQVKPDPTSMWNVDHRPTPVWYPAVPHKTEVKIWA